MNFLRTIFALCSSFGSYRSVRDQPLSSSLKFLLGLMTVLAAALVAGFVPAVLAGAREAARWVDEHVPAMRIQAGRVVTAVPQPYYAGDTNLLFVLDTTGQVTAPATKAAQGILFTADSFLIWVQQPERENQPPFQQRQSLRGFPDGEVNGLYFQRLVRSFLWVGLPVLWVLCILVGALVCLLQAYLFSLVGSLLERQLPGALQLGQLLNIAIHAVAPAGIIFTAYTLLRLEGLNLWLVYLIAYGIFLIGATNACRDVVRARDDEE